MKGARDTLLEVKNLLKLLKGYQVHASFRLFDDYYLDELEERIDRLIEEAGGDKG